MKIKFETEVQKCHDCPFCYYYSDNHELCGVYFCRYRETLGESYAFADEKGIHKNCPFLADEETTTTKETKKVIALIDKFNPANFNIEIVEEFLEEEDDNIIIAPKNHRREVKKLYSQLKAQSLDYNIASDGTIEFYFEGCVVYWENKEGVYY